MKAIKINNEIKAYNQLPKTWKNHMNFRMADETLQKQEGFFDVVNPEFNTETQRLGEIYWDESNQVFTYPVEAIPQSELDERKQRELDMMDRQFDNEAAKRLLRKVAEPILADEANLAEQDIEDAKMLYPVWRGTGIDYEVEDKVRHEEQLYKVIQPHTSQSDWSPDVAVSLFTKFRPAGAVEPWVQPESTNPYMQGEKVTHNSKTWISDVDNNVWEPGVYGWSEL